MNCLNISHLGITAEHPDAAPNSLAAFEAAAQIPGCDGFFVSVSESDPDATAALADYFSWVKPLSLVSILHLQAKSEAFVKDVVSQIREKGLIESVRIVVDDPSALSAVTALPQEIAVGFIEENPAAAGDMADLASSRKASGCSFCLIDGKDCSKDVLSFLKSSGLEVFAFTGKNEFTCSNLLSAGVDGILSDDPAMVTRQRRFAEIEEEYPLGMSLCGFGD